VPAPPPVALHGPDPLLQRDRELDLLETYLDHARDGRGGVAAVTGPLGIGKSALLAAARDLATARGMTVLAARGAPLERDYAYAIVRRLFEPLGLEAAATDAALLTGAAALAGRAFANGSVEPPAVDDGAFATIHGLYWLTANLTARSPVLLVVDDCHWADAPSLRFLAYLAARLEELRALLLVAVRSGEAAHEPTVLAELVESATAVRPRPLDLVAASALIRARLGPDTDEGLCRACVRATGGNPLLLLALVGSLAEAGGGSAPDVTEVAAFGAASVGRVLTRQLARLPAGASAVAAAIAVLGPGAPLRHIAALSDVDTETAAALVDAMRSAAILAVTPPLDFAHPILRAAVEDDLTATQRARTHRRAARVLSDDGAAPERRAVHLLHTVPAGDAATVDTLREAARVAADRGAPETAEVYLRRALDEPPTPPERGRIQLELGLALLASRRDPDAPRLLREAIASTDEPHRLAAAVRAARALGVAGFFDDAAALDGVGESPLLQAETLAASWLLAERVPGALERTGRLDPADVPDDLGGRALLVNLAHRALLGPEPVAGAVELLRRAIGAGDLPREESLVTIFLAMDLVIADEFDLAVRVCTEAIAEGQRRGSPSIVASFAFPRALAYLRRGQLADAEADARWSFDRKLTMGPPHAIAWPLGVLVEILVARGDLTGAEAALNTGLPAGPPPQSMGWALVRQARGRLLAAQGRPRDAVLDLVDAGERWAGVAVRSPSLATWRGDAARALVQLGDLDEARRLAEEQQALAEATGLPRVVGNALGDLAAVGSPSRIETLERSVELLSGGSAPLELARAVLDLGAALRRAGRRVDARQPLRHALDLASRAGAAPLADRAHAELLAAGARPRRPAVTGRHALTASERRVSALAAGGLTNREIAERLFVTQRTVETHLQHAFNKLGVHRREELPAALAPAPVPQDPLDHEAGDGPERRS